MHILPAVDRKGKNEEESEGKKRTLKQDRDAKRKAMAGKEFNWALLYMNVRIIDNIYISKWPSKIQLIRQFFLDFLERCGIVQRSGPHEYQQGGCFGPGVGQIIVNSIN